MGHEHDVYTKNRNLSVLPRRLNNWQLIDPGTFCLSKKVLLAKNPAVWTCRISLAGASCPSEQVNRSKFRCHTGERQVSSTDNLRVKPS
jgi:hypothetical protein